MSKSKKASVPTVSGAFVGVLIGIVGVFVFFVWMVMILLGIFASMIENSAFAIGFDATFILMIIAIIVGTVSTVGKAK